MLSIGYSHNKEHYENLLKLAIKEQGNKNYAKGMRNLMQVKMYAKDNKLYDMEIQALNQMGILYKEMLSYDKAIECYLESYQIASKSPNKKYEIILLNNIGNLYYFSKDMDKAEEYFERACKMAIERNDNFAVMHLLHNLVAVSNNKENLEQAEKHLNFAMERIKQFPEDPNIIYIKGVRAEYLYLKKEYDSAEQFALEVLNMELSPMSNVDCLFLLSKIYNQKKNYPQAIAYANDALHNNSNLQMMVEIYEHLSTIYRATNSPAFAWQYQESAMITKDSLLRINNINQILRGQIQFNLNNLEKEMGETKAKQKQEKLIFTFIIIFFLVIIVLAFYIRTERNKRLEEQKRTALLELKMSENKIELKNKQLVSNTLFQLSKNELMEEIIEVLSNIPAKMEIPELPPVIQKLKSQIKEPASADWNSFITYFEQANPAFLSALKKEHPDLTANDIRLSSYIYLNLDTKEISKLLHITPDHCKKKKQRLAQKLGLQTPKLYAYLAGMGEC